MAMHTERLINQMQGVLITYELHYLNETLDAILSAMSGSVTHTTFDDYVEEFYADKGYAVTFQWSGPVSGTVDVFYAPEKIDGSSPDFSTPDEANVSAAVSRNMDTGKPDSTGNGWIFFSVTLPQGYYIDGINFSNYNFADWFSYNDDVTGRTIYIINGVTGTDTVTIVTTDTEPEPEPPLRK